MGTLSLESIELNAKKRSFPLINGIAIDLESLYSISHRCNPALCGIPKSCCSNYEVWINKRQLPTIVGVLPEAAKFSRNLRSKDGLNNVFDELNTNTYLIESDQNGLCVFAYSRKNKGPLCSLHSAALLTNKNVFNVKPVSCSLWPLALSASKPQILSIQNDAFSFKCNKRRKAKTPRLNKNIEQIIETVFGIPFLDKLNSLLAQFHSPSTK